MYIQHWAGNIFAYESAVLKQVQDTPDVFESIIVTAKLNCCGTEIKKTLVLPFANTDASIYLRDDASIILYPAFFNKTVIEDGIYSIEIRAVKKSNAGFLDEANCAFIDMTFKCKIAGTLEKLLEEHNDSNLEPVATNLHLLHYALVNGSNCKCNCDDLCEVFKELHRMLSGGNFQINPNCGC